MCTGQGQGPFWSFRPELPSNDCWLLNQTTRHACSISTVRIHHLEIRNMDLPWLARLLGAQALTNTWLTQKALHPLSPPPRDRRAAQKILRRDMGGGLEVDLSHGAVAALWRSPPSSWRPVLQVADARHVPDGSGLSPAPEQRYRLDLSDGVHLQPGTLAASLNHLVRDGALRRGSVVHVLDSNCDYRRRTIVIIQLQILQPECALIGSLKLYEPTRKSCGFSTRSIRYAPRPDCEPYYGGQHIHQSGIASEAEERTYHGPFGGSSLPGRDTPCSLDLPAEPAAWKTVGQIKDEYLGYFDRPYFITVKADISFIGTEHFYCSAACPLVVNGKRCNVEASSNVAGMWHGKRHGQRCGRSFGFCDSGYLVHIQIQDHTGTTSATAYGKAAKEIFGCTAKDLYLLEYEEQDYKQLDDIILGAVSKQFVLKLKVQAKPYSDARHMKCVVLKAEKVNPSAESCRLREAIDAHFGDCLGSCLEFGSSMPTYSSLSDLKGCSAAQSSNSSHTISPGRARQLCSADGYRQQVNEFYMEPSTLSAFGACGWGRDHRSDIDGQRSSAPDGFMGRFHGASPGVNIALDMRPMVLSHRQSANLCAGD